MPKTRLGFCAGCPTPLLQGERSPGIWRPLFCAACARRESVAEERASGPLPHADRATRDGVAPNPSARP